MNERNHVVKLSHKTGSRDSVLKIICDKEQFSGRDLIMTGVGLEKDCESCSWLYGQIDAEIKCRGLTWNSF